MPSDVKVNLTKVDIIVRTSALINLEELGVTAEEVSKFLGLRMSDYEQADVMSVTCSMHKIMHDAIESAVKDKQQRLYPGFITVDMGDGRQIETARWLLTAAKILRRIRCSFYCWTAKII
jgi:hypothetical protein